MQICPVCKKQSVDGEVHIHCSPGRGLNGLVGIWRYDGAIKKAIWQLKFRFIEDAACELAEHGVGELKKVLPKGSPVFLENWTLVPVPLHFFRKNWRGFNQSESVGKYIADSMGWKFVPDLLIRNTRTKPQVGLKKDERKENVKGVFSLNPIYQLHSTSYVIFDDVWTTGSTMQEACRVLKKGGAKDVWGLTIAS